MLGDLFDFAKYHVGDAWSQMKDDPERMFLGAATPLGTKMWGGILGEDWEPMVNEFGGATDAQFNQADAEGLNTGPSRVMGGIADTIAGIYGGAGAASGLGSAFGSMGGGSGGGFMGQVDTGGPQGGFMGQIDSGGNFMSQVDTGGPRGGFMSQVDTGSGGGFDAQQMMQAAQQLQGGMGGGGQQQQAQQAPPPPPMPARSAQTMPMPEAQDWYTNWMRSRRLPGLDQRNRS